MEVLGLVHKVSTRKFHKVRYMYPKCRMFSSNKISTKVRVRFAPSPTGLLHLGGFRTALLNYLFALRENGKFIVRIEDTDQTRLVPNASQMIEEDLGWLGIPADESPTTPGAFGPYVQSQRLDIYQENLETLINSGNAYECFCTERRIDLMRKEAVRLRQRPRYDNKCRDLTRDEVKRKKATGERFCVRFKMEPEKLVVEDLVGGPVKFDLTDYNYEGDPIIMKSDGYPTYHFASVVDDHLMEITHVLRGVEWQISTPKHLQMYRSFGWQPPKYAHLPLIMNTDGTKLSKRQGDISIQHYKESFYYPLALVNFVTKSGGGFVDHGVDKIYDLNELAISFELSKVNTQYCKLDFALLAHLNQIELSSKIASNPSSVALLFKSKFPMDVSDDYLKKIIQWCPERVSTLKDLLLPQFSYLWSQPSASSVAKISLSHSQIQLFAKTISSRFSNSQKDSEDISLFLHEYAEQNNMKLKTLLRDLRLILCGLEKGPPIAEIFFLFGPEIVLERLENAVDILQSSSGVQNM